MEAVTIAQTPGELYNSILIDTPLSEFFTGFSEADLDEMNIEIIRNTLFKHYIQARDTYFKALQIATSRVLIYTFYSNFAKNPHLSLLRFVPRHWRRDSRGNVPIVRVRGRSPLFSDHH